MSLAGKPRCKFCNRESPTETCDKCKEFMQNMKFRKFSNEEGLRFATYEERTKCKKCNKNAQTACEYRLCEDCELEWGRKSALQSLVNLAPPELRPKSFPPLPPPQFTEKFLLCCSGR